MPIGSDAEGARGPGGDSGRGPRARERQALAALAVLLLGFGFAIYLPSFAGGPISDDHLYLLNPWVTKFQPAYVVEFLDPRSQVTLAHNNYAPLRPLVHAAQWRLFPENAPAYHATNVVLHAIASFLLAMLLRQAGLPVAAAAVGGALFLAHPANVEAVAWMSQLWSPMALSLALGALLAQRRRPLLGWALFALALLSKPSAVFALPMAILRAWSWRRDPDASVGRWAWIAAWAIACAAVAGAELGVFAESESAARAPVDPDTWVQARTIFANAARYLAMAAAGHGVSAFQEPRPALSWLDPAWLAGSAAVLALGARTLVCLARGREEAAWWTGAAAAFLPVSQIFPFLYPVADRYLYFMLPGLIGGALLAGAELARSWEPTRRRQATLALAALGLVAVLASAAASRARAAVWTSEDRVLADAAIHHPEGVAANLLAARRAARAGDVDGAIERLEACRARGWDYYAILLQQPDWEPVRSHARFQALVARFADGVIAEAERRKRLTQMELWDLAGAYRVRARWAEALGALERARAVGGPLDAELPAEMARLRVEQARAERMREDAP